MKRTRWWLATVVIMALLIAACGGETEQGAGNSAPASSQSGGAATDGAEAARAVAGDTATGQTNAAAAQTADRKIVVNVSLDLTVKDVQSGFEQIGSIAEANGGLVAEANVRQEAGQRRATVTIRVPVGRYQDVLAQVRGLAVKVDAERTNANDVTEEFTDIQSRQRNLEATEQQLLTLLGQARNVQEVLQVQERLTTTRGEIERIRGRINVLTRLSDLATIKVQLQPEAAAARGQRGPLQALQEGWEASTALLGTVWLATLMVVGFSWWLLPFTVLLLWLLRREARRRPAAPPAPPPTV